VSLPSESFLIHQCPYYPELCILETENVIKEHTAQGTGPVSDSGAVKTDADIHTTHLSIPEIIQFCAFQILTIHYNRATVVVLVE
jgi:hypothetical protein